MPRTLRVKTIIVGSTGVGKTALTQTFCSDGAHTPKTYSMTLGVDISSHIMPMPGRLDSVDFCIVDCSGHKDYMELVEKMWDQNSAAVILYDITDRQSFEDGKRWGSRLMSHLGESATYMPAVMVGNKKDLETRRAVPAEEGESYAESLGMSFVESSATDWESVLAPFSALGHALCKLYEQQVDAAQSLSAEV